MRRFDSIRFEKRVNEKGREKRREKRGEEKREEKREVRRSEEKRGEKREERREEKRGEERRREERRREEKRREERREEKASVHTLVGGESQRAGKQVSRRKGRVRTVDSALDRLESSVAAVALRRVGRGGGGGGARRDGGALLQLVELAAPLGVLLAVGHELHVVGAREQYGAHHVVLARGAAHVEHGAAAAHAARDARAHAALAHHTRQPEPPGLHTRVQFTFFVHVMHWLYM